MTDQSMIELKLVELDISIQTDYSGIVIMTCWQNETWVIVIDYQRSVIESSNLFPILRLFLHIFLFSYNVMYECFLWNIYHT